MVRPKIDQSKRKKRTVSFRLTDTEFARLSYKAAVANLPVSRLARRLALSNLKTLVLRTEKRCDPALIKQLQHIGHNLNQLTKNAHIFGRVSIQVEELCVRIDALIDEAIGKEDGF